MNRRGRPSLLLLSSVLGLAGGTLAVGVLEIFPTLVLPHGGWEHLSSESWLRVAIGALVGAAIGLTAGAIICRAGRK